MRGYVLREGEGRSYIWNGFDFTVKAGHPEAKGAVGFMEFACERGDEPTDHVHDGEDEIFVLLEGALTVRCGTDEFDVDVGDFVFLPRNLRHGFTMRTDRVRMLVVTAPDDFSRRIEAEGEPVGDAHPAADDGAREAAPSPPEPIGTLATTIGTCKWWRDEKGYGVIRAAATGPWDIWCHFSVLQMEGYKKLTEGQPVEVDYVRQDRESFKYVADAVRVVE